MERDSCICRYEIDSDELRSCTVVVLVMLIWPITVMDFEQ